MKSQQGGTYLGQLLRSTINWSKNFFSSLQTPNIRGEGEEKMLDCHQRKLALDDRDWD